MAPTQRGEMKAFVCLLMICQKAKRTVQYGGGLVPYAYTLYIFLSFAFAFAMTAVKKNLKKRT